MCLVLRVEIGKGKEMWDHGMDDWNNNYRSMYRYLYPSIYQITFWRLLKINLNVSWG